MLVVRLYILYTPLGNVLQSNLDLKGCSLAFGDRLVDNELIVLNHSKFDIILDMDCLFVNYENVDYHKHVIIFYPLRLPTWSFVRISYGNSI